MAYVDVCPDTEAAIKTASKRLDCKNDTYGNNQYMCIPNEEKSSLIEFCFQGIMGIELKGSCLEASYGRVNRHSCSRFTNGCPDVDFYKYNVYKYPECQKINKQRRCYIADPSCQPDVPKQTGSDSFGIYAGIGTGVTVLIIVIIVACILYYIWKKARESKSKQDNRSDEESSELTPKPPSGNGELTPDPPSGNGELTPKPPSGNGELTPETPSGNAELSPKTPSGHAADKFWFQHPEHGTVSVHGKGHKMKSFSATPGKVEFKFQDPRIVQIPESNDPRIVQIPESNDPRIVQIPESNEPTIFENLDDRVPEWMKVEKNERIYSYRLVYAEDQTTQTQKDKLRNSNLEKQAPNTTTGTSGIKQNKTIAS